MDEHMRNVRLAFVAAMWMSGSVFADGASNTIESTIQNQLNAFLADDFATAFTFASPGIQQMFRSPENFGLMVRQGYPMVWRHADVQFLDRREVAGSQVQKVQIQDANGTIHVLEYQMVERPEGWRINGVWLLESQSLGA